MGYLDTNYSYSVRPKTSYPKKLISYLISRFEIKENSQLLDLGCGSGDFSVEFSNRNINVTCADIDSAYINKTYNLKCDSFDFENDKYPYPDNYFDYIFTKSVIEHIHDPDNFFKECKRILKPGGGLLIMAPDWKSSFKIYWDDITHKRPYTKSALDRAYKIYSFNVKACEEFYQYPLYWKYPFLKFIITILKLTGPVSKVHKNSIYRWSKERMILGFGEK